MKKLNFSQQDVIEYLKDNPDFFIKNSNLVESIQVTNRDGSVASLANHQINLLKQRNSHLKKNLSDMVFNASENEKLMSQIFEIALKVGQYTKVSNVLKCFIHYVDKIFSPDWIKVVLPENDSLNSIKSVIQMKVNDPSLSVFDEFFQNNEAVCGRLQKSFLEFFFKESSPKVGSSILLPLGNNSEKGMLIFASKNEERFHPNMSTDLLNRLSQILESKLKDSFEINLSKQAQE